MPVELLSGGWGYAQHHAHLWLSSMYMVIHRQHHVHRSITVFSLEQQTLIENVLAA